MSKYTITLPYTSLRCSNVERGLVRALKSITPEYNLCFAWTLIKIGRVITPRLKTKISGATEQTGCCYVFTCNCGEQYVGETTRRLRIRIAEHGRKSSQSGIAKHIWSCSHYLHDKMEYIDASNLSECKGRKNFLIEHFQVLACNLKYFDLTCYESIAIKKYRPTLNLKTDTVKPLKLF